MMNPRTLAKGSELGSHPSWTPLIFPAEGPGGQGCCFSTLAVLESPGELKKKNHLVETQDNDIITSAGGFPYSFK